MKKQLMIKTIADVEVVCVKKHDTAPMYLHDSAQAAAMARAAIPRGQIGLREFCGLLMVKPPHSVVKRAIISAGGMDCTIVDPRLVFMHVLLSGNGGFILFHNHPSGDVNPSSVDFAMTRKIADGACILELNLLDHIIISEHAHYSFAENGLL